MAISQDEVLLTDEQVRRFVTDGYLVLNANVAPGPSFGAPQRRP